jgi:PAS domain S-box-containing protein
MIVHPASIRQRAEERLKKKLHLNISQLTDADILKLLHELEVHQIELELQNEELQSALDQTATATALYDFSPTSYMTLDQKGRILEINLTGAGVLGIKRSSLINCNLLQFITADTQSLFIEFYSKILSVRSKQSCEIRLVINGIPSSFMHIEGIVTDDGLKCLLTMVDITACILSDKALQVSEARHKTMIENIGDVISIIGPDGYLKYASPNVEKYFGWKPEELVGTMDVWNWVKHEDIEGLAKIFDETLAKVGESLTIESSIKCKDGNYKWVRITGVNRLNDPNIEGILVNYHDISERKLVEAEVLKQKSFFEQLFSQSSVSTQILDKDGWCERINPRLGEIFGVKAKDIEGKKYNIFKDESILRNGIALHLDKVFKELKAIEWDVLFDIGLAAESQHIEVAERKKSWFHNWAYPILDEKGELMNVIIQHNDITERKNIEEAHKTSELRLHTLVQTIPDLIWLKDKDGKYLFCNKMFERFFGATESEIKGKTDYDFVNHELADSFRENDRKTMNLGKSAGNEEWIIFRDDGHRALFDTIKTPMFDFDGKIIGVLGIGHDITKRKRVEAALKESEERYRGIFENATIGLYRTTPDGQILLANPALIRMLGYDSFEELASRNLVNDGFGLDYPRTYFCEQIEKLGVIRDVESAIRRKDNTIIYIRESARGIRDNEGQVIYYEGAFEDITQRKQAEDKLKLFLSAVESGNDGIIITSLNGTISYANHAAIDTFGYTHEELMIMNVELLNADPIIAKEMTALLATTGRWSGESISIKKNREQFPALLSISAIRDNDGKPIAMMGIFQDITEKKEAARKVNLLAHSLESISECVSITDNDDIIIYINESFIQTYGFPKEELIGKHISILRPTNMTDKQSDTVNAINYRTINGGWKGEIINKKKDGTLFPILLSTSVIKDENENAVALIGVARDITELKANREELIAAKEKAEENDRLKSAFLANMSHEIRTPMNAIIGFSDLMVDGDDEDRNLYAEIVQKSSKQLLMLIDDVIQMSRLQSERLPVKMLEFKPAELVSDVCQMFDLPDFKKSLDLVVIIPIQCENLAIHSDKEKIRQVLTNFVSNALKYTLTGSVELGFAMKNGGIEFYVKDTGIGIPEHERERIFEMFYRGKEAMVAAIGGTGLGLKIAKELVELMGGHIGVDSEMNIGSRFYFTLPILPDAIGN